VDKCKPLANEPPVRNSGIVGGKFLERTLEAVRKPDSRAPYTARRCKLRRVVTHVKPRVGVTSHAETLEIEGLFAQGSRPGRTLGESVGGILEMDNSDWSNRIQYRILDIRPDTGV
jgi:hypothetical protein